MTRSTGIQGERIGTLVYNTQRVQSLTSYNTTECKVQAKRGSRLTVTITLCHKSHVIASPPVELTILIILHCQSYYGWPRQSWVGGTEFSQDVGDTMHVFLFKGADPHTALIGLLAGTASMSYAMLHAQHFTDFTTTFHGFSLGQTM
ncbi:hypothetical protein B0H10DRAFT_1941996 [Mycena sp. CBHHK59/15]|nr:hypothetical protein B0H10DRAFT_1941996 [Mycena sp. CBHHK59/15]